jgi:hypothetical protein
MSVENLSLGAKNYNSLSTKPILAIHQRAHKLMEIQIFLTNLREINIQEFS